MAVTKAPRQANEIGSLRGQPRVQVSRLLQSANIARSKIQVIKAFEALPLRPSKSPDPPQYKRIYQSLDITRYRPEQPPRRHQMYRDSVQTAQ
jgi:hypothetical protein